MRKSKIFNLSSISIVICECIQYAVVIFIDLFFVSNILRNTSLGQSVNYNIIQIGLFYLIWYAVLGVSYFFTGYYLKKYNKSVFVSIGAIGFTITITLIYFLEDKLITFLPLISAIYGLSFAFFSSGYHNLTSETISSKHQVRFFAVKRIALQCVSIILPVTLGFLDSIDFSIITILMAVLCVGLVVFSFLIKPKQVYKLAFNIPKFYRYLKNNKQSTEPLKYVYLSNFFRGASYDNISTILTILVFITMNSTTTLGILQSVFTLCSIVTMFLYLRYYRKKRAKAFIFPCIILVALAALSIICVASFGGTALEIVVIVFYGVYVILNVIIMSISDSRRASVVRILSLHSHILESTSIMEFSLASGRIMSTTLLILAGVFDGLIGDLHIFLLIAFGFVVVMYIMYGIMLYFIERSLIRQDEQFHKIHVNELFEKVED